MLPSEAICFVAGKNDSVMLGGLVVTNMQNIWQKSLKKHTSVSLLTVFLLPGFYASRREGKTSPFTPCPLCTAQGQPLGLVPSQGKPCSTQWLSDGNCCWFLPCHLPDTFSYVEHLFPSFLFPWFPGQRSKEGHEEKLGCSGVTCQSFLFFTTLLFWKLVTGYGLGYQRKPWLAAYIWLN